MIPETHIYTPSSDCCSETLIFFNCVEFIWTIINGACITNVSQTLLLPNSDYCLEFSIYENLYCIKI